MKRQIFKLGFLFSVLLVLDLARPFSLYFRAEFLFSGIILAAIYFPGADTLILIFCFGVLKDFSFGCPLPVSAFSFTGLAAGVYPALKYFPPRYLLKKTVAVFAILAYTLINALGVRVFSFYVNFIFFLQSLFVFFIIEYLARPWTVNLSSEL